MKKYYSSIGIPTCAEVKIQYGKENGIEDYWKEIIAIEDTQKRYERIDQLVDMMSNNKSNNGFFAHDDCIEIRAIGNKFTLDDNTIYHMFFDNIKNIVQDYQANNIVKSDESIIFKAIGKTEKEYFGGMGANRKRRQDLTAIEITDDDFIVPSIKALKGQNCSLCTERAAISHNLWLLTGRQSYYINSASTHFENISNQYINDGHCFNIVEYGGKFRLCDFAMDNYCGEFKENPIDTMLSGRPLNIERSKGINYPGTYANADKVMTK